MNVLDDLCYYDPRHPDYQTILDMAEFNEEPPKEPRKKGCGCDNCFYGRDRLAVRILELEARMKG